MTVTFPIKTVARNSAETFQATTSNRTSLKNEEMPTILLSDPVKFLIERTFSKRTFC